MVIKMTSSEVIEACRDWIAKNHGFVAQEGAPFVCDDDRPDEAISVSVIFSGVKRLTPYRE